MSNTHDEIRALRVMVDELRAEQPPEVAWDTVEASLLARLDAAAARSFRSCPGRVGGADPRLRRRRAARDGRRLHRRLRRAPRWGRRRPIAARLRGATPNPPRRRGRHDLRASPWATPSRPGEAGSRPRRRGELDPRAGHGACAPWGRGRRPRSRSSAARSAPSHAARSPEGLPRRSPSGRRDAGRGARDGVLGRARRGRAIVDVPSTAWRWAGGPRRRDHGPPPGRALAGGVRSTAAAPRASLGLPRSRSPAR